MVRGKLPQVGFVVSGVVLSVILAGCGGTADTAAPAPTSSDTSSTPAPTTSTSGTDSASSPPASGPVDNSLCKAKELEISLGRGDGAAGTVYRPLTFKNSGDRECTIQGFPGVSYVAGDDGHQVGPAAFRVGDKGAAIKLAKGQTASADVGFVNVGNFDATVCQPQAIRGIRIYPPQETESKFVEIPDARGCSSDKIPGNQLTVRTIVKS